MGRAKQGESWLEDFSIVLRPDAIRSMRQNPEFDVFTGSKLLAGLWISVIAALAGALGGMLAAVLVLSMATVFAQAWRLRARCPTTWPGRLARWPGSAPSSTTSSRRRRCR